MKLACRVAFMVTVIVAAAAPDLTAGQASQSSTSQPPASQQPTAPQPTPAPQQPTTTQPPTTPPEEQKVRRDRRRQRVQN